MMKVGKIKADGGQLYLLRNFACRTKPTAIRSRKCSLFLFECCRLPFVIATQFLTPSKLQLHVFEKAWIVTHFTITLKIYDQFFRRLT